MTTPANASNTYKRQIQEIAWAGTPYSYYVKDSAELDALQTALASASYMYTKDRVANAVTGITDNLVTGTFTPGGAGTPPPMVDSEVYLDQYIRFDESSDGSNYTRWYKVRQYIDSSNIYLYETLPTPAGTYQGYQIGRLIWRQIVLAQGEYNMSFGCIPGLAFAASCPGTVRLVEQLSAPQPQFTSVSENMFFGLDFYPNENWDSLDAWMTPADSHWAGNRLVVNNCRVRHGMMGDDHAGGYMTLPMFKGGTTVIQNSYVETGAQVGSFYDATATADITEPISETRLIWKSTDVYRVGEYKRGLNLLGANQFHTPANASTYLSDSNFIWDEIYEDDLMADGEVVMSNILVGDFGGGAGVSAHSQNAKLFCRNIFCKTVNAAVGEPAVVGIFVNEATAEVIVDASQFEVSSGNTNSAAMSMNDGAVQRVNNCTITSNQNGLQIAAGSDAVLNNVDVDAKSCVTIAIGATCTINGGKLVGSTYAINNLFGTLHLGPNVILDGPEQNFGTIDYTHSGNLTLNGATPVAATLVNAGVLGPSTKIILSRKTAGGTLGHFSVTARTDRTGFSIVGQAGDTSVAEWFIVT